MSTMRRSYKFICLIFCLYITTMTMLYLYTNSFATRMSFPRILFKDTESMKIASYEAHLLERGFTYEQIQNMSLLGKWLLAPEGSPPPTNDPWENCSVQNCALSYEDEDLHRAHAVVFHVQFLLRASNIPQRSRVDQRWIMLMDESPMNCLSSSKETLDYDGLFNWTMTYRMNSDVPIPYGRTIRKASSLQSSLWEVNLMDSKTKLLAVMISHCGGRNQRMDYIKALKPLLRDHLDIIGGCISGNSTICPRHFHKDCSVLSSYKFYLSFENSDCREYMTEKVFWNAFHKHAVPIIMGAPLEDCRRLLPPGSYLHVANFSNAHTLADYLLYLNHDDERYIKYHEWRDNYVVLNEHGYFGSASKHYCRTCEALNYNSNATKVYKKLRDFWNKERDCIPVS